MNIRTETWLGHSIRFVEKVPGEWWAVAADVAEALGLKQVSRAVSSLKDGVTTSKVIDRLGREQEVNVLSEKAIYRLVFKSKKKEAEAFQDWVFEMLKHLRQSTGLEGFQIFRMLDKDHQKEAMQKLRSSLKQPVRVDFIKANTIANKAVSSKYGHPKMLKKDQMTPDMLVSRQDILEDTVDLMGTKERFGLDIAVSQTIYDKHIH
ncbi:BRO family protein [Paenibacillus kribbensis]|uniref:BRO-N domain-containing protein n=1 Tax=Paenibacillus kribbensis TaxID=172713 RepID=UPI002DBF214D|nr:BRO family protein [Paenibacillus kribbensis]MEC0237787.1 BRO family protein [Paenibacillus kribbensis]